jgi:hypothetical protein
VLVVHVLDLLIDARRIGKKLVEAESADHVAHGGLTDLIDSIVNILNHDHRFFRIRNAIVGDGGDVDRDIVLCDDFCEGICIVTVRKDTRTICYGNEAVFILAGDEQSSRRSREATPRAVARSRLGGLEGDFVGFSAAGLPDAVYIPAWMSNFEQAAAG